MGNSNCVTVYMWLLLFISVFDMVISESRDEELLQETPWLAIKEVWATSDAITISLVMQNVVNQKVVVSVQKENDRSVTMLDFLNDSDQGSATDNKTSFVLHKVHTIEELSADTKYEICVSLTGQQDQGADIAKDECIFVKTFPIVDNITGFYVVLAAIVIFFIILGVSWLLYKIIFANFFSKHDK